MAEALTRRFLLTGIETTCSIGIHDFERAAPQRVLVDVEVLLAADKEPEADHIDDALNYDDIRRQLLTLLNHGILICRKHWPELCLMRSDR